jgi:hypothetical protein
MVLPRFFLRCSKSGSRKCLKNERFLGGLRKNDVCGVCRVAALRVCQR